MMKLSLTLAVGLTSSVLASPTGFNNFKPEDVIERDVVILGGGAAGAYAAVRLRDAGKSVVVIEKEDHLGGHVNTYSAPESPFAVDYGVIAYLELPGVADFFKRFDIDLFPAPDPGFSRKYIDFTTGRTLTSGNPITAAANPLAVQQALSTYGQLAAAYLNHTFPSLAALPTGAALPADLALPFGDFVAKYNLQAALPTIWGFVSFTGDVLRESTAYVLNQFGAVHLNATANSGLLMTGTLNNSVLYDRIAAHLGAADVLYRATAVRAVERTADAVALVVADGTAGCKKLVKAKKLLVTIPPLASTLAPIFGPADEEELDVFSRWTYRSGFVGVLNSTGLPDGVEVVNASPSNASLNLPGGGGESFVWNVISSGLLPGVFRTNVVGDEGLTAEGAKGLVADALSRIGGEGGEGGFAGWILSQGVWVEWEKEYVLCGRGLGE
ncbi:putative amine flavin-containing superfamily [Diplodia seriata]|uniref:Putative amine flavin-containing superfamily n=1 Tax=Diplodia seriata TaxID=420778 RepID=A0A0G2E1D1_9PEZI|nr:putative amine flavin-containing superfamily [Diplodia seriata]